MARGAESSPNLDGSEYRVHDDACGEIARQGRCTRRQIVKFRALCGEHRIHLVPDQGGQWQDGMNVSAPEKKILIGQEFVFPVRIEVGTAPSLNGGKPVW